MLLTAALAGNAVTVTHASGIPLLNSIPKAIYCNCQRSETDPCVSIHEPSAHAAAQHTASWPSSARVRAAPGARALATALRPSHGRFLWAVPAQDARCVHLLPGCPQSWQNMPAQPKACVHGLLSARLLSVGFSVVVSRFSYAHWAFQIQC